MDIWTWVIDDDLVGHLPHGQAVWMTRKLVNLIRKKFYDPPTAPQPGFAGHEWTAESPDHHRSDCEACLARRCPDLITNIRVQRRIDNTQHDLLRCPQGRRDLRWGLAGGDELLEAISWVLLDSNRHPFEL